MLDSLLGLSQTLLSHHSQQNPVLLSSWVRASHFQGLSCLQAGPLELVYVLLEGGIRDSSIYATERERLDLGMLISTVLP